MLEYIVKKYLTPKINYNTIVAGLQSIANLNSSGRAFPVSQLRLTMALEKAAQALHVKAFRRQERLLLIMKACMIGMAITIVWFIGSMLYIFFGE